MLYFLLVYYQYNKLISYQVYEINLDICMGYVIEYQWVTDALTPPHTSGVCGVPIKN